MRNSRHWPHHHQFSAFWGAWSTSRYNTVKVTNNRNDFQRKELLNEKDRVDVVIIQWAGAEQSWAGRTWPKVWVSKVNCLNIKRTDLKIIGLYLGVRT